jgi:hypothetical protein
VGRSRNDEGRGLPESHMTSEGILSCAHGRGTCNSNPALRSHNLPPAPAFSNPHTIREGVLRGGVVSRAGVKVRIRRSMSMRYQRARVASVIIEPSPPIIRDVNQHSPHTHGTEQVPSNPKPVFPWQFPYLCNYKLSMTLPVSHVDEDPFLTIRLSVVLLLGHIVTQTS